LAEVISKLKFPEGFGRHPFTARVFGRINGQWKNLGEDRLPSLEAARLNFEKKKDFLWKDFLEVKDAVTDKNSDVNPSHVVKLPSNKAEAMKATLSDGKRLILMGLVEDFFENHAGVKWRKTLQWGDMTIHDDGSRSIRYQYDARAGYNDINETYRCDKVFTFGKNNELLSFKDTAGPSVRIPLQKMEDFIKSRIFTNSNDVIAVGPSTFGEIKIDKDGNISIVHECQTTMRNKDVLVVKQDYTFDKNGEFLQYKNVEGYPKNAKDENEAFPAPFRVAARADDMKNNMMALVEDFFANNFRDVTSRETIEWGDAEKDKDGNSSIRYKYEATIWEKDVQIMNQIFTFDKKGEFVRVKDVEGFPQKVEKKSEGNKTSAPLLKGVNLSPEEIDKRWSWVFEDPNAKKVMSWGGIRTQYIKASLDVARAELNISEDANKRVPGCVPDMILRKQKLDVDLWSRKHEYCIAVQEGDEKAVSQIALCYAESNVDYRQTELDLGMQSNKRAPGSTPEKDIERFELQVKLAKIDLETVKMILKGDNNARQEGATQRAELEAKLQAVQPKK
jgi:hypothetical protein